jgi:hypothetical protein
VDCAWVSSATSAQRRWPRAEPIRVRAVGVISFDPRRGDIHEARAEGHPALAHGLAGRGWRRCSS